MAGRSKSLKWNGRAVTRKMGEAQIEGVNQTMAACVNEAKANHEWENRSGILEGGIDIADYAKATSGGVKGTWGVQDVIYARILEEGGTIGPKNADALAIPQDDGSVRLVREVTIPARPYLRPAADKEYPKLATRIRKAFSRRSLRSRR